MTPSKYKATIEWGGRKLDAASNIVFSNGGRDPWRSGGVLKSLSDSLVAINIREGAHHLDLMFSNDDDPDSVKEARKVEEEHITRWIEEAREKEMKENNNFERNGGGDFEDGKEELVASRSGGDGLLVDLKSSVRGSVSIA